jgi:hypothetical protein
VLSAEALLEEMRAENLRCETEPPPEVVRVFHQRIIDSGAGTEGLPLLTWFFAANDARYVCAYSYQILRLDRMGDFTVDQLKLMVNNFIPQPAEFIGYCGLNTVWRYTQNILEILETTGDRDTLQALLGELQLYGAHLNAWIHHYYPWGIGYIYQPTSAEDAQALGAAFSEAGVQ